MYNTNNWNCGNENDFLQNPNKKNTTGKRWLNFIPAPRRPRPPTGPRRHEEMKFAPAKQFHSILWPNRPLASIFHGIFKIRLSMHGALLSFPASPVGRMLHFSDLWHHLDVFENRKIPVLQTTLHISSKSTKCNRKVTITMSTNRSQNYPRRGITLQA